MTFTHFLFFSFLHKVEVSYLPETWHFLVADQLASATSTFENPGVDNQKVQIQRWVLFLQKLILFCDGEVFFIDRGLLMGANSTTLLFLQICKAYHSIFKILKLPINSYL